MVETNKYNDLTGMYVDNVQAFVEDFLGHFLTCRIPPFHSELYKALPAKEKSIILAPRGFSKSSIATVFYSIHQAVFGLKKDILIISDSQTLAEKFLRTISNELLNNQRMVQVFGKQDSKKWTEAHIVLLNGTQIRASGTGGKIRGMRPDLIILDDIENDESVLSEDRRNKLRTWVTKSCLNALVPKGQFIWIGTVINDLCLINEFFQGANKWQKFRYQAYIDGIEESGHELWGELWSHRRLQERKLEIGSTAFATEFMNDPMSNDDAPIKSNMLKYWEKLPEQITCCMILDFAYSQEAKADWKVCSLIGSDIFGNRYLERYIRTHKKMGDFFNEIINMYRYNKNRVMAIGIPNTGTEKEAHRSFLQECQRQGVFPPIVEIKNVQVRADGMSVRNKRSRIIAALQPKFEQGRYYVHLSHTEAIAEILGIGVSRWDDIVDTLAAAEQILGGCIATKTTNKVQEVDRYGRPISDSYEIRDEAYSGLEVGYGY